MDNSTFTIARCTFTKWMVTLVAEHAFDIIEKHSEAADEFQHDVDEAVINEIHLVPQGLSDDDARLHIYVDVLQRFGKDAFEVVQIKKWENVQRRCQCIHSRQLKPEIRV